MAKLIITTDGRDKVYEIIDERFTIGSGADADLQLRGEGISGIHLTVDKTRSGYRIVDMETMEGTLVNGKQINQQTLEKLIFKRGSLDGKKVEKTKAGELAKKLIKTSQDDLKKEKTKTKLKPVFRLNPPSKGYKSIRISYPKGDLGHRGEKINELLKRMI